MIENCKVILCGQISRGDCKDKSSKQTVEVDQNLECRITKLCVPGSFFFLVRRLTHSLTHSFKFVLYDLRFVCATT